MLPSSVYNHHPWTKPGLQPISVWLWFWHFYVAEAREIKEYFKTGKNYTNSTFLQQLIKCYWNNASLWGEEETVQAFFVWQWQWWSWGAVAHTACCLQKGPAGAWGRAIFSLLSICIAQRRPRSLTYFWHECTFYTFAPNSCCICLVS